MRRLALCGMLALSGCSAGSFAPVTISQAIAGVQADLTKAGVVSVSGVQHWTANQAARFDANVRALQCEIERLNSSHVPYIVFLLLLEIKNLSFFDCTFLI